MIVTLVTPVNADAVTLVRLVGIVIDVNAVQLWKAEALIVFMLPPNVKAVRLVTLLNMDDGIVVFA